MSPSTFVFDLDGVVYLSEDEVPGAGRTLEILHRAGHQILFCTNNSSRTRSQSAAKIARVTGYDAHVDQIASSAISAGHLLASGETVIVIGGDGVTEAVTMAGATLSTGDTADAVVVGIDPGFDYAALHRASAAVRAGARFIATNRDVTYPTPNGLRPGAGSIVAAVEAAAGTTPHDAGKPGPTMRALLNSMIEREQIVMIGDRPDTDLAMAHIEGWTSVLVLTGVTETSEGVDPAPTHVIDSILDLPGLVYGSDSVAQ